MHAYESIPLTTQWLEVEFLGYLDRWERSVREQPGLSKTQQNKMLLSPETLLGLRTTGIMYQKVAMVTSFMHVLSTLVKSFVALVKYAFTIPGVTSFLSEKLCQDPLDSFFGCQRQRGRVNENPTVHEFCQNTQALRVVNSICQNVVKGNCCRKREKTHVEVENRPLMKRRRVHK